MARKVTVAQFTFVANYGLGTYLDQQEASTANAAVETYARSNDFAFLSSISAGDRQELKRSLSTCKVEPAGTLKNVWACTVPLKQDLFLLHVVQTA